MKRRRALGTVAGLLAFGGCLDSATTTPDGSDTPTAERSSATPPAGDLRVSDATVAPELVALNSPDSIGTYGERDEQYVVASVAVAEEPAPDPADFALDADGETYDPMAAGPGTTDTLWDRGRRYDGEEDGWVGFELPKPLSATDAAITWTGGEHALGDDAVEALARPPTDFVVRSFEAPASVENGGEVPVSLAVENVGEADGTFVGALNRIGPMVAYTPEAEISLPLAAGETDTWEYVHDLNRVDTDDGVPQMELSLLWRDGSEWMTVEVESD